MRIYIADDNRHQKATGYGQLSRSIIRALSQTEGCIVCVDKRKIEWEDIPFKADFDLIPDDIPVESCDVALSIRNPKSFEHLGIPTAIYTQNALGDLPYQWIENLKKADSIIVPGQFDKDIFDRYFKSVYICPQNVDSRTFRSRTKYREEGAKEFTFLYIGSWSYRKGCDLIMPAVSKAFAGDLNTRIHLHCFSGMEKKGGSNLIEQISRSAAGPVFSTFAGTSSPSWISRFINRADAVFTLSRGEGWCMPLYEALLCGKPIIAPDSTAMGEWLPKNGVRLIKTRKKKIESIDTDFGQSFKSTYGVRDNYFWEPDFKDTVEAFKDMKNNYSIYQSNTEKARSDIENNFSLQVLSNNIMPVLRSII